MQILPVVAICGHLCGLHITATTAIPLAVLTGVFFKIGIKIFLYFSGMAAWSYVSLGYPGNLYFLETTDFSWIIMYKL